MSTSTDFIGKVERFIATLDPHDAGYIDRLIEVLGPNDNYDDFDWGQFMYEWNRPGLRLYVSTKNNNLEQIDWLDPNDMSRTGTVLRTAWKRTPRPEE